MSSTSNPIYKVDGNGNVVGTEVYTASDDSAPPVYASQVMSANHSVQVVQAVPAGSIPHPHHVITVSSGAVDPRTLCTTFRMWRFGLNYFFPFFFFFFFFSYSLVSTCHYTLSSHRSSYSPIKHQSNT
jgi:hypothetical protein